MSMVPGWRDAIFPMYHAITSLQGGVAIVVASLWIIRKYFKLEKYIHVDQFWSLSRLLFALTLLWKYFFYSAFIVFDTTEFPYKVVAKYRNNEIKNRVKIFTTDLKSEIDNRIRVF